MHKTKTCFLYSLLRSDVFNAISPTKRLSGNFEHKPLRSMPFLNGNRGLKFFTLPPVSYSLGRFAAASQCKASGGNIHFCLAESYSRRSFSPCHPRPDDQTKCLIHCFVAGEEWGHRNDYTYQSERRKEGFMSWPSLVDGPSEVVVCIPVPWWPESQTCRLLATFHITVIPRQVIRWCTHFCVHIRQQISRFLLTYNILWLLFICDLFLCVVNRGSPRFEHPLLPFWSLWAAYLVVDSGGNASE